MGHQTSCRRFALCLLPPAALSPVVPVMGAGASVSDQETVRVQKLIEVISGDKHNGRLSALKELTNLCDQNDYKIPLIERGNLLPILVKILSETGDVSEDQAEAAKCGWYLARGNEAKLPTVSEKGMVAALVSFIQRSQGDERYSALSCIVNCANISDSVDYLLDPAFGLLDVIVMVITTDTNEVNGTTAYKILANITKKSWIPNRIGEFLRLDLQLLALNVLKSLGPNPDTWKDRYGTPSKCLSFLMYISAYPEAAMSLKSAGALDVLTPLLALKGVEAIKAALIVTFLAGKDESSSQKFALLQAHPHLTDILVDLMEAQLSGGTGAAYDRMINLGYDFAWYPINLVVRGILALSISDANKGVMVATRILSLLVQLLRRFCDNAPPVCNEFKLGNSTVTAFVGGGGDDIAAAAAAIETIVQLTFFFDSNTELIQQFITPESGVEKLFGDLLELSASRQLDRDAKGQVCKSTPSYIYPLLHTF